MHLSLLDDTAFERAAPALHPPAGSRRRVLLVATAPPALRDLFAFAGARGDPRAIEVYVLCPPLHGFLRQWTSDVWPARHRAAQTLESTLEAVRAVGMRTSGRVGDDDRLQALADAARTFEADEIVLSTGADPRYGRLEQQLVRFAQSRFRVPVTHLEAPPPRSRSAVPRAMNSPQGAG